MEEKERMTTIAVWPNTKAKVAREGRKDEKYDDIFNRILDELESRRKKT